MNENRRSVWSYVWDAPVFGPLIQTVVLLLPIGLLGLTGLGSRIGDGPGVWFGLALLEIVWLWLLQRIGGHRLVTPLIPIPWLWLFVLFAIYNLLALLGLVEPF